MAETKEVYPEDVRTQCPLQLLLIFKPLNKMVGHRKEKGSPLKMVPGRLRQGHRHEFWAA